MAAARAGLPAAVLERLAHDPVASVRAAVAANPSLSSDLRARLGRDPYPFVQRAAGRFASKLPDSVVDNLDTMPLAFRQALAGAPAARGLLGRLVGDTPVVTAALARNRATPADTLRTLAASADPITRAGVAQNPGCPAPVANRLASDVDPKVRAAAATHPLLAKRNVARLAVDPDPQVRALLIIADEFRCDEATLRLAAIDPDPRVRFAVALHPRTPPDVLRALAVDRNDQVRQAAAGRSAPAAR
ncbi:MAG TPA: hypothetical protein VFS16_14550 [Acidimicrobiia bacterium]|nr:hypothetical protein [Acidimicrobiia bacterium]